MKKIGTHRNIDRIEEHLSDCCQMSHGPQNGFFDSLRSLRMTPKGDFVILNEVSRKGIPSGKNPFGNALYIWLRRK